MTIPDSNSQEGGKVELLPCPFCGGSASTDAQFGREWWVECDDCAVSTGGAETTREAAIAVWNKRSPTPSQEGRSSLSVEPTDDQLWDLHYDLRCQMVAYGIESSDFIQIARAVLKAFGPKEQA